MPTSGDEFGTCTPWNAALRSTDSTRPTLSRFGECVWTGLTSASTSVSESTSQLPGRFGVSEGIGRVCTSASGVEVVLSVSGVDGAGVLSVAGLGVQSAGGGTVAGPAGLIVVSGTATWLLAVFSISHR